MVSELRDQVFNMAKLREPYWIEAATGLSFLTPLKSTFNLSIGLIRERLLNDLSDGGDMDGAQKGQRLV